LALLQSLLLGCSFFFLLLLECLGGLGCFLGSLGFFGLLASEFGLLNLVLKFLELFLFFDGALAQFVSFRDGSA